MGLYHKSIRIQLREELKELWVMFKDIGLLMWTIFQLAGVGVEWLYLKASGWKDPE